MRDRVGAGRGEVAGVDAQPHVRVVQDPLDLLAGLDQGPDVRVDRCHDASSGGVVGDAVEVAQQRLPLHVVEHGALVVAREAGRGSEHDDSGTGREAGVDERVDLGQGVAVRVVQHDRQEPADGA